MVLVVVGDCGDCGGGDGGRWWNAADVACASYAGVGVGRLGGWLGRVDKVEHGARHLSVFFFLFVNGWRLGGGGDGLS